MIGDQRKEVRCPARVHRTAGVRHVVAFSHQSFAMGHVLNLSPGGLQLEYQSPGADPLQWETIDIFSRYNHQLYLLGIGCRLTYDMTTGRRLHAQAGRLNTRVAGLRFGRLGSFQKEMLRKIIAHCAEVPLSLSRRIVPESRYDSLLPADWKSHAGAVSAYARPKSD